MFIIPIYLFSEIFPAVLLAPGPIHQFGRHWTQDSLFEQYRTTRDSDKAMCIEKAMQQTINSNNR